MSKKAELMYALSKLPPNRSNNAMTNYEKRVQELESEGMTRSDAQGVADAELNHASDWAIADMESIIDALDRNPPKVQP